MTDSIGRAARMLASLRALAPILDDPAWVTTQERAAVSTLRVLLAEQALQDRKLTRR